MQSDVERIAEGLSDAQRGWLCGSLVPNCKKEAIIAMDLERIGLLDGRFDITPLGQAVREYLMEKENG